MGGAIVVLMVGLRVVVGFLVVVVLVVALVVLVVVTVVGFSVIPNSAFTMPRSCCRMSVSLTDEVVGGGRVIGSGVVRVMGGTSLSVVNGGMRMSGGSLLILIFSVVLGFVVGFGLLGGCQVFLPELMSMLSRNVLIWSCLIVVVVLGVVVVVVVVVVLGVVVVLVVVVVVVVVDGVVVVVVVGRVVVVVFVVVVSQEGILRVVLGVVVVVRVVGLVVVVDVIRCVVGRGLRERTV